MLSPALRGFDSVVNWICFSIISSSEAIARSIVASSDDELVVPGSVTVGVAMEKPPEGFTQKAFNEFTGNACLQKLSLNEHCVNRLSSLCRKSESIDLNKMNMYHLFIEALCHYIHFAYVQNDEVI